MSKEEEEIMKLGPEHVGKMVKRGPVDGMLIGTYCDVVWVDVYNSSGPTTFLNGNNWEIIEPEKKPSEIINKDLVGGIVYTGTSSTKIPDWYWHMNRVKDAICRYLDEEFEKRKGK